MGTSRSVLVRKKLALKHFSQGKCPKMGNIGHFPRGVRLAFKDLNILNV
jgi:hypothetical protein